MFAERIHVDSLRKSGCYRRQKTTTQLSAARQRPKGRRSKSSKALRVSGVSAAQANRAESAPDSRERVEGAGAPDCMWRNESRYRVWHASGPTDRLAAAVLAAFNPQVLGSSPSGGTTFHRLKPSWQVPPLGPVGLGPGRCHPAQPWPKTHLLKTFSHLARADLRRKSRPDEPSRSAHIERAPTNPGHLSKSDQMGYTSRWP